MTGADNKPEGRPDLPPPQPGVITGTVAVTLKLPELLRRLQEKQKE